MPMILADYILIRFFFLIRIRVGKKSLILWIRIRNTDLNNKTNLASPAGTEMIRIWAGSWEGAKDSVFFFFYIQH